MIEFHPRTYARDGDVYFVYPRGEAPDASYRMPGPPVFSIRYLYLWPFRDRGKTYFLTWSQEEIKDHWYVVPRPEPDSKAHGADYRRPRRSRS